jgi:hypothetical protein
MTGVIAREWLCLLHPAAHSACAQQGGYNSGWELLPSTAKLTQAGDSSAMEGQEESLSDTLEVSTLGVLKGYFI